jgi:hypothetical protein
VSSLYSSGVGKKIPIENGTRIPNVIQSYDNPPIGPLYSVGEVSAKNFGQNRENKPAAAPNKTLPNKNT